MKIFSGESNKPLAEKIARALNTRLSGLEIYKFPDSEKRVRVLDNMEGEDCAVIQSAAGNPDGNYMELFFIADALKRSAAKSITAVVPYLGYQRQDHMFRSGEAVSVQVIIETLESIGITKIITLDLHSIRIPELFHLPISHLSALPMFARNIKKNGWDDGNSVLVSPDMGGIRRIKLISEMPNYMPYASIEKNRDLSTGKVTAEKINGKISSRAIIVDDMISSGKTMALAAELLLKRGAREVYAFATHPVFSKGSEEILQKSAVKKIYVTDSILVPEKKMFAKLEVLSVAEIISASLS